KAYWSEKGWTIDGPLGLRIQGSRIAFHENGTISHNFQPNGAVGFIFRPILKGTSGLLIRQFSSDASFTGFFDGLQGRLQKAQVRCSAATQCSTSTWAAFRQELTN